MRLSNKNKKAVLQISAAAIIILALHLIGDSLVPGWLTWALGAPALVIITTTAAARVHDITGMEMRWFVRRLGMLLAAGGAVSLLLAPILGYTNAFPTWRSVALQWGFALAWLTTPNMPPWWKYITGEYRLNKDQRV